MPAPAVRRNFGKSPRMDATDRKILRLSQEDATRPVTDALRVGLSATPCRRRIRKPEESGGARVALLDADKPKAGVTVLARTDKHDAA